MAKLYKGGTGSKVTNSKISRRTSGLAVPYQPVRGGAKVLGSKKASKTSKDKTFKLQIKTIK